MKWKLRGKHVRVSEDHRVWVRYEKRVLLGLVHWDTEWREVPLWDVECNEDRP